KVADINSQPKEREKNSSETNENNNDEEQTNEQHSSNGSNSLQEIEITLSIDTGKRSEGGVPVYRTEKMKTRWEFPLPIKITGNKDHANYTIEPINITSLNGDRNLEIDMLTLRFRTWEDGNQRGRLNADQYVLAEIPNFVDETNADWFGDRKEVEKIPDRLLAVGGQIQLELAAKGEKSISSSSRKASN
ncbi:14046_t:CDS:2, partial [Cetraspora pellucida]